MFCSAVYLKKLLDMRQNSGYAKHVNNIVMFDKDEESEAQCKRAKEECNINVFSLDEVREAGRENSAVALAPELVEPDTIYFMCYTSGTTGDSKGVKISHWGLLSSAYIF